MKTLTLVGSASDLSGAIQMFDYNYNYWRPCGLLYPRRLTWTKVPDATAYAYTKPLNASKLIDSINCVTSIVWTYDRSQVFIRVAFNCICSHVRCLSSPTSNLNASPCERKASRPYGAAGTEFGLFELHASILASLRPHYLLWLFFRVSPHSWYHLTRHSIFTITVTPVLVTLWAGISLV